MRDYRKDFAPFRGHIWLNAASEGPLPISATSALNEAIKWKSLPYLLDNSKFVRVPMDLKSSIGQLIGVHPQDVILGNSASYGLHILANGIPWKAGDEILLMQNDFPTNILPWLALKKRGVKIIQIPPQNKVLTPKELLANITERTKLFCISHVHTFTGYVLEIAKFTEICKVNNVIFVLNLSQSVGTMKINVEDFDVDAVVAAGYKWLCGPYGTGFCWMRKELRDQLDYNHAYWVSACSEDDLKREGPLQLKDMTSARKYDTFGTANFFNFVPFQAALSYWLDIGLDNVRSYHDQLLDRVINGLDPDLFTLISPREGVNRSSLIVLSHVQKEKNEHIFKALIRQKIYTGLWKGNIRLAPHVYNTYDDIDQMLAFLNKQK